MSQNPFGHPFDAEPEPVGPPRTSALAVGALASCLICCLPLVGLIPTALGVPALISISRSNGRMTGRGLAIVGIVLGLLGQMFWCGLGIGVAQVVAGLKPYAAAFEAVESGNLAAARTDLTTEAAAVPDERFDAFRAAYREKTGAIKGFRSGLKNTIAGWIEAGPGMSRAMENWQRVYGNNVIPLPADFDNGPRVVLFVIDPDAGAGPSGIARIRNIGVADEQGQIIWLIDPAAGP